MKIALFGATGGVGGHFLTKALSHGHQVMALVRSAESLSEQANRTVISGDATNASDVQSVIDQADVAVSCLGNVNGELIMEKAADRILTAAASQSTLP